MLNPIAISDFSWVLPGDFEWDDLVEGRSAVTHLPENYPAYVGAPSPVAAETPVDWDKGFFPRALGLGLEALNRLDCGGMERPGLVLGLPNYYSEVTYLEHILSYQENSKAMALAAGFYADAGLQFFANQIPNCGPRIRLDSACATGNDCLIVACQWLQSGMVRDCLVLASSAMLDPMGLALFSRLKAINSQNDLAASCPFDRKRRGFVMGEGAVAFWLTTNPNRAARAFITGYGQRLHAENFVDLPKDLNAMAQACKQALGDLEAVDYVCAHGTATQLNDLRETQLHHTLFGQKAHAIPLSSVKSMVGHTLGAAALVNAGVCVNVLETEKLPPTINLTTPDPDCDLNYVPNDYQERRATHVLSNAFAFGGQHTSVLFSRIPR